MSAHPSTDTRIDRLMRGLMPMRPLPGIGWLLLRWTLAAAAHSLYSPSTPSAH